jgi:prolyl oligopeptidase
MPCVARWDYPPTKTVDASDTYFGKTYNDPYRWLENLKDKDVEAWFKAQAELTDGLLAKIPGRDALAQEWMELDKLKPAAYSGITYEHGRVFYKKTLGGENVGKLFFRDGWNGLEKLLFDPATYKPGVTTTIQSFVPSWDGKNVVIAFSSGGAEYSELRILDVERGTLLPESIYPSYGAAGWTKSRTSKASRSNRTEKPNCTSSARKLPATLTSSATKATPISESRPRSSPAPPLTNPIPTISLGP